jgi:hypothetical protein
MSVVQIPELSRSHITRNFLAHDRFPTLTPLYKHSKHACEFHTNIYKQLLFTHFLLFFRCFCPVYLLVPSPHRPPRPLPRRAPPPSIPTLSDKHWWLFFLPAGSLTVSVMLEKDHARKRARAWLFSEVSRSARAVDRP